MMWTDALLDAKRHRGDPLADAVIAEVFAKGEREAVNTLMNSLVRNDGLPPEQLPQVVRDYLAQTSAIPIADPELVRQGEQIFGTYGPEMLMVLGFYSLPASYAAKKGVQVLYRTAYLLQRPVRRVFETTQMVVDVMAPGGLEAHGRGVRTAQKVRLMHAAIRHLTLHDPAQPWDLAGLGVPINQEDLAGTLMTFSFVVMEGLERLNIQLSAAERAAYLHAWQVIGRIMGIDEDLIPATVADAETLTATIRRRQIGASLEGQQLTAALIDGMQSLMPSLTPGLAGSMVHHFLDNDPFQHQNVAAMLGVAPANWTLHLVHLITDVTGLIGALGEGSRDVAALLRLVSRPFVRALLEVERGGTRPRFAIPDSFRDEWQLGR
jgi:hypothetical protein